MILVHSYSYDEAVFKSNEELRHTVPLFTPRFFLVEKTYNKDLETAKPCGDKGER